MTTTAVLTATLDHFGRALVPVTAESDPMIGRARAALKRAGRKAGFTVTTTIRFLDGFGWFVEGRVVAYR